MSNEQLVAEQEVAIADTRSLTVRISQHLEEEFWRVAVSGPESHVSATVAAGDNFMMNLIEGAVSGEPVAWRHLAQWGRDALHRGGAPSPRLA